MTADVPVLVANIARTSVQARWPVFASAAVGIGRRAAFAVPLLVGDLRLGAQDYAAVAVEVLLELHNRAGAQGVRSLSAGWGATSLVAQATGMVMVQLEVAANGVRRAADQGIPGGPDPAGRRP